MSTFLSTLTSVANLAKSGFEIYVAVETVKMERETAAAKQEELLRQRRIQEAEARRTARVKTAQQLASQGAAGAITSTVDLGVVGIQSSLTSGLQELEERTDFNLESVERQGQAGEAAAITSGLSGVVTTAENFSSFLNIVQD